jgi:alkylhydroperoxidase family enzyme
MPTQDKPRVPPLSDAEMSEEQRELLARRGNAPVLNIFRTLVRHTDLYRAFMKFGAHILGTNTIDPRKREILILRVGHLCKCPYELHQHTAIGKRCGLTELELERIAEGPTAPGWTPLESAMLQATDELHKEQRVSDATWKALSAELNEKQLIDLVFTVGQYTMVSMALSTFGVQIESAS